MSGEGPHDLLGCRRAQIRPPAQQRARDVRLLALDVDGTLTDGRLFIGADAEMMKAFSVRDGFGLNLLARAGIAVAIVTGRRSAIVERRAAELAIPHVLQAVADKAQAIDELCARTSIPAGQFAYLGDDWPDLPAMMRVGLPATVVDAPPLVREQALWIGSVAPGRGAVREFCDWLLAAQGRLDAMAAHYTGTAARP